MKRVQRRSVEVENKWRFKYYTDYLLLKGGH